MATDTKNIYAQLLSLITFQPHLIFQTMWKSHPIGMLLLPMSRIQRAT